MKGSVKLGFRQTTEDPTSPPPPPLNSLVPPWCKKSLGFVVVFFFIFKRPARHTIYRQDANVLEMQPGLQERVET